LGTKHKILQTKLQRTLKKRNKHTICYTNIYLYLFFFCV